MNAFILQTIALSLGIFLIGLFLGWLLKKLFCKGNSNGEAHGALDSLDTTDSSSTGKSKTVDSTDSDSSITVKVAGVSVAAAGAAAIAKNMSDVDIKSDIGTPNADRTINTLKEKAINQIQEALPESEDETLTENFEQKAGDIQKAVNGKAENLIDTAKESFANVTDDVTSSADGLDLSTAKAAITTAAGAVAATATAGASLLNKDNEDTNETSGEKASDNSRTKKSNNTDQNTLQSSKTSASFTAVDTVHRTIRRRHRSRR